MPQFENIRQQLDAERNNTSNAQEAYYISQEKLNRIRREKEELARIFNRRSENHVEEFDRLNESENSLVAEVEQLRAALDRSSANTLDLGKQFEIFTDPREQINKFNDAYPVLLLPVRIETRFKKIGTGEHIKDQLWIRVFPDDCAVDTFEKLLSETEIKNTQLYWAMLWEAAEKEESLRAAWRTLVSSHGSGRASYMIGQYKPVTSVNKPTIIDKDNINLIIFESLLPSPAEQTALEQYWKKIWRNSGNKTEETNAYNSLITNVGATQAAALIKKYVPFNLKAVPALPFTKEDVKINVFFLKFPPPESIDTKLQSWSQPPQVTVMPDRFVIMGYQGDEKVIEAISKFPVPSPLIVGPDPGAAPEKQFTEDAHGDLNVHNDIRWMVDFEASIEKGLGFKIDITPAQATTGFDRIIALGVRISADELKGKELLESLIDHHRLSRKGFSLLKQGTATNNTDTENTEHQKPDNPDESFEDLEKEKLFETVPDPFHKKDGQWLAESLGIDHEALYKVKNTGHTDQSEGRLMNVALWPATLGYMMETLMHPVFDENDIIQTRGFFNQFVCGRGSVPAIKIGKQPYGILPATAFSKIKWFRNDIIFNRDSSLHSNSHFVSKLYTVLAGMDKDWASLVNHISYVGKPGDAHQIMLDAVGLNPASIEFYQRTAESKEDLFNRFNLMGIGGAFLSAFIAGGYIKSGQDILQKYGYTNKEIPDILNKFFLNSQNLLKGPVIDDRPLSERELIRSYTPGPYEINYIDWLINAAQTSHDTLRKQQGFIDNKIPKALLYLMLHHALDLSYVETSLLLLQKATILSPVQVREAKADPAFLHIKQQVKQSESKWQYLYTSEEKVTGNTNLLIGDYIPQIIKTETASAYLNEQVKALEHLKNIPTARLERAFTEHLDCCNYRLDAWKGGIINYGLSLMRDNPGARESIHKKGVYIGAYGWLENVRSENKVMTPVQLSDEKLHDIFIKDQAIPLVKDSTNGGYLLAPSLNHAVTASILRNGYISNKNPDALRVNLSSQRIRKALSIIEGIRGGQSLGALLGYHLERGLHDGYPGIELDYFIYQLRKAFPLTTNRNKDTRIDETSEQPIDSVETIEARNVIDGLSLIEHIKKSGSVTYPFGKSFLHPVDTTAQSTAINKEVQNLLDINDAVADVAIAESVHQIVQGNYDRGAATLDTYSKGNFPPIPDVIQTPKSGKNITHRVGLHFETGLNPAFEITPRAKAEPGMNKWLKTVLPDIQKIVCLVSYGGITDEQISMKDLGLEPIDVLYSVNNNTDQSMKELDDKIVKFVLDKPSVRPDTIITINYMKRVINKISFFELAPLLNSLRSIILRSRPLLPTDIMLPKDVKPENILSEFLDVSRVQLWYTELNLLLNTELSTYGIAIDALTNDVIANRNQIINQIDDLMSDYVQILSGAGKTGLPQTGFGFVYDRKKEQYTALIKKLKELINRWDESLLEFNILISEYETLPPLTSSEDKFAVLQKARSKISTLFPVNLPADPDTYKTDLLFLKGTFIAKKNALNAISLTTTKSLGVLLAGIKAELPVTDFDLNPFEITDVENSIILFAQELAGKAGQLIIDLTARLTKAKTSLDDAAVITDSKKKVEMIISGGKQLYGEDFKILPEFRLASKQADEWANAFGSLDQLLKYSVITKEVDFPVDDWIYGVARVREKLQHWENTIVLTEAFGGKELTLHPIQLPHKINDSWLALSFPEAYDMESDRLLYTAHYPEGFDKSKSQCGLLLDEWTDLIPSKKETAGVAFHYDRPNAEPPQAILLAIPSEFKGSWEWQDLVDTVNETLDMAKKRAIEPAHIDTTAYARFLPALLSSMTTRPITPSLNFSFNNNIHETMLNNSHE